MASSEQCEVKKVEYHDHTLLVTTGDYAPILKQVITYLTKAIEYAANPTEAEYLQAYIG